MVTLPPSIKNARDYYADIIDHTLPVKHGIFTRGV